MATPSEYIWLAQRPQPRTAESTMSELPLVLVHGLWDKPELFSKLEQRLAHLRPNRFVPHLQHNLGAIGLEELAVKLNKYIIEKYGPNQELDILGFSMGGIISRIWIQKLGGYKRTRRFICVGSPQKGTLAAQLIPKWLLPGIAQMKLGSILLNKLNKEYGPLNSVECYSFYCKTDITVFPGWLAVLPIGISEALPVWTHRQLIVQSMAIERISQLLLAR
jgi:triacylglycerol lipase